MSLLKCCEVSGLIEVLEVLELLLQYGWDINEQMDRNEPPLMRSILHSSLRLNIDLADRFLAYRYVPVTEKWVSGFSTMVPT